MPDLGGVDDQQPEPASARDPLWLILLPLGKEPVGRYFHRVFAEPPVLFCLMHTALSRSYRPDAVIDHRGSVAQTLYSLDG